MMLWGPGSLLPLPCMRSESGRPEGLSSYFVRLAVAHVVPTQVMALRVLPQVLDTVSGHNVLSGRRGIWMNGSGQWASALSRALEHLTLQDDLDRLTLHPWHRVLPPQRLLASVRRWCPQCYREMRLARGECWDPLLWSIAAVVCCTEHADYLSERCPVCQRLQPWLPRDTALGRCAWCGSNLDPGSVCPSAPGRERRASPRDLWMARVCADLVDAASRGDRIAAPAELARRLLRLLEALDEGNRSAFARRFGVSVSTPAHWLSTGIIRFEHLLRGCWRSSIHPGTLLLQI